MEARDTFIFVSELYEEPPTIYGLHDVVTVVNVPAELVIEVSGGVEHIEVRPSASAGILEPIIQKSEILIQKLDKRGRVVKPGADKGGDGDDGDEDGDGDVDDDDDDDDDDDYDDDDDDDDNGADARGGASKKDRTMHLITMTPEPDQYGTVKMVVVVRDWIGTTKQKFMLRVEGLTAEEQLDLPGGGRGSPGFRVVDDESKLDPDEVQAANPREWTTTDVCNWLSDKNFEKQVASFQAEKVDGKVLLEKLDGEALRGERFHVGRAVATRLLKEIDDLRDVAEMLELQAELEEREKREAEEEEEERRQEEETAKAKAAKTQLLKDAGYVSQRELKEQEEERAREEEAFLAELDPLADFSSTDEDEDEDGFGGAKNGTAGEWSGPGFYPRRRAAPSIYDPGKRRSADAEVFWLALLLEKMVVLHNVHVKDGAFWDLTAGEGLMCFAAAMAKGFNRVHGVEDDEGRLQRALAFRDRFEERYREKLPYQRRGINVEFHAGHLASDHATVDWSHADVALVNWNTASKIEFYSGSAKEQTRERRQIIWGDLVQNSEDMRAGTCLIVIDEHQHYKDCQCRKHWLRAKVEDQGWFDFGGDDGDGDGDGDGDDDVGGGGGGGGGGSGEGSEAGSAGSRPFSGSGGRGDEGKSGGAKGGDEGKRGGGGGGGDDDDGDEMTAEALRELGIEPDDAEGGGITFDAHGKPGDPIPGWTLRETDQIRRGFGLCTAYAYTRDAIRHTRHDIKHVAATLSSRMGLVERE